MASLEIQLEAKKKDLLRALDNAQSLTDHIYSSLEMRNGLCIRCLTKPLLGRVLSFLGGKKSSASSVCKYWYLIAKELERPHSSQQQLENLTLEHSTNGVSSNK